MKKAYIVSDWDNVEVRIYHDRKNAMQDFDEIVDIAQDDEGVEILDISREECADEIFAVICIADNNGFHYASVVTKEFEDEE